MNKKKSWWIYFKQINMYVCHECGESHKPISFCPFCGSEMVTIVTASEPEEKILT